MANIETEWNKVDVVKLSPHWKCPCLFIFCVVKTTKILKEFLLYKEGVFALTGQSCNAPFKTPFYGLDQPSASAAATLYAERKNLYLWFCADCVNIVGLINRENKE